MDTGRQGASPDVRQRLAENIRRRRDRLRMSQVQLAKGTGLGSAQIMSSIERGEREVKAVELAALAKALHCDLTDLLEEEFEEQTVIAWRERPAKGAEGQEARFLRLCAFYALAEKWVHEERDCDLPDVAFPRAMPQVTWARAIADEVGKRLDLGSLPAASLRATLEERCGVKIFYFPNLRGAAACARGDFGAAIALNASDVPWRRNFSLAHELFHLVTWDWLGPEQGNTYIHWPEHVESMANAFASSLLLPEYLVRSSIERHAESRHITWRGMVEVAREFSVSSEALVWRLVSLNFITDKQARELLEDQAFRSMDRRTVAASSAPQELPERFVRLLETAYLRGEVSSGRIAEITGQDLAEVHHRLNKLEEDEAGAEQLVRLA